MSILPSLIYFQVSAALNCSHIIGILQPLVCLFRLARIGTFLSVCEFLAQSISPIVVGVALQSQVLKLRLLVATQLLQVQQTLLCHQPHLLRFLGSDDYLTRCRFTGPLGVSYGLPLSNKQFSFARIFGLDALSTDRLCQLPPARRERSHLLRRIGKCQRLSLLGQALA